MPKGLKATFYDDSLHVKSFIKSNYGIRYTNKETTELKNNVMVINVYGDTLTTEDLIWDENKNKIYSNDIVTVKTPKEIIVSKGFESNPTFTKYKFYHLKGTVSVDQNKM